MARNGLGHSWSIPDIPAFKQEWQEYSIGMNQEWTRNDIEEIHQIFFIS